MKKDVIKPTKVAICRGCGGTGYRQEPQFDGSSARVRCPHCAGSGRVFVSCKLQLDIRPYKETLR
ncbi:molecular chaperone DnaJ [Alloprevotella tannerae]|uniref:molecular chaperone DnaJ n=1 Tax=Alloprevotella tannerae TaxID=76122 RepID=UPI0028ECC1C7|nr:molecular chaperone DnaJ [Alloprevotella tannerae]